MEGNNKKYDLEERTAKFGEDVIVFINSLPKNNLLSSLYSQLLRAATSVGANYCEADCAETKKDFEHKIGICNKEAKECKHWFRMIAKAVPNHINEARKLWQEAHELNLIFITIIKNAKENDQNN